MLVVMDLLLLLQYRIQHTMVKAVVVVHQAQLYSGKLLTLLILMLDH